MDINISEIKLAIIIIGGIAISAMIIGAVTNMISELGVGIAVASGISAIAGLAGYEMKKGDN